MITPRKRWGIDMEESWLGYEVADKREFEDNTQDITVNDLITSPALKVAYNRYISASNWVRWQLC